MSSATLALGSLAAADGRPAVIEPGRGCVSYAELDRLADRVAARLRALGLVRGARVGLYLRRSTDAIAAMIGALRAGCAFVPVDPSAPVERNAEILGDCEVALTLVEERYAAAYRSAARDGGHGVETVAAVGVGRAIGDWAPAVAATTQDSGVDAAEVACVFYTSGTTGRHKGWRMTRSAITAFADWSHRLFAVGANDVFASQAPFHFAMSLFDIFSSLRAGGRLLLVPDEVRPFAARVVALLASERATILFATPAFLGLIAALDDLELHDLSNLRLIVFGGEMCPAPMLRTLRRRLAHPRYFHCWGSTETNIGTHYEIPADAEIDAPPPIGRPSAHYQARVVGEDGRPVAPGQIGELQLRGPGLTVGYLHQPELNAERLLPAEDGGTPWYRTCDLVIELSNGDLRYAGRIGRMVKIRGHRVEPGEIETRLYEHPAIKEAGVVAVEGPHAVQLIAHVSGARVPIVELKAFCAVKLPAYMIPERFVFHDALPRTSRGKLDLARLREASG